MNSDEMLTCIANRAGDNARNIIQECQPLKKDAEDCVVKTDKKIIAGHPEIPACRKAINNQEPIVRYGLDRECLIQSNEFNVSSSFTCKAQFDNYRACLTDNMLTANIYCTPSDLYKIPHLSDNQL